MRLLSKAPSQAFREMTFERGLLNLIQKYSLFRLSSNKIHVKTKNKFVGTNVFNPTLRPPSKRWLLRVKSTHILVLNPEFVEGAKHL